MLPGYDIMSQRLPSVTEAEASVQCLVSRGSLSLSWPEPVSTGPADRTQLHSDQEWQQWANFPQDKRLLGMIDCGQSLQLTKKYGYES